MAGRKEGGRNGYSERKKNIKKTRGGEREREREREIEREREREKCVCASFKPTFIGVC